MNVLFAVESTFCCDASSGNVLCGREEGLGEADSLAACSRRPLRRHTIFRTPGDARVGPESTGGTRARV